MNEQLAAIKARRAAITPGVWGTKAVDNGGAMDELQIVSNTGRGSMFVATVGDVDIADVQADATFIAAAPTDIDTLLAMVDSLESIIDKQDRDIVTLQNALRDNAAERDALAAQLAQAQRELNAVPVDAIRKMRFDAEVELHGYTNAELDAWLDAEQDAANAAAELRAPTYNGGCW